jgi:hypothetical protein
MMPPIRYFAVHTLGLLAPQVNKKGAYRPADDE